MGPITRFGNFVQEIFGEIKEDLGLQKHLPIGRMSATKRNTPVQATSLSNRLMRQISKEEGGQPLRNKASTCLSFANRLQLLVFSMRLRFADNLADLVALKKDVES